MQAASLKCRAFTHSPVSGVSRRPRPAACHAATAVASKHLSTYSTFMGTRLVVQRKGISQASAAAASSAAKQPTSMSFFGVGAPEAILVAIVSLIVFGPKGLAEAAKSIGQSLRAFKPTIKEVVEVSQDLRSTLESELGLDELREAAKPQPTPRSAPKPLLNDPSTLPEMAAAQATSAAAAASTDAAATTTATPAAAAPSTSAAAASPAAAADAGATSLKAVSDSFAKAVDPQIEAKRAAAAAMAWGAAAPAEPAAAAVKDISQLSLEELEAELARRRKAPSA